MLKVLELFGGIGACSNALKKLGISYEIVDYVEIDKHVVQSYNAIYGTNFESQDITTWDKNIEVDLIMHGSPCQDFSHAGKQAGGDKDSGTRSSLMYETLRIVENLQPKYVIWENVKNILSKKHRHNFDAYLKKMNDLGYVNYYKILNAKDYGIPQNRERVFTISIRSTKRFEFPPKQKLRFNLKNFLENTKNRTEVINRTICLNSKGGRNGIEGLQPSLKDRVYDSNGIAACIATSEFFMPRYTDNLKIRKLTPKECWLLMGFSNEDFEKAAKVNSNTQLYKQAGNSIVVNVLMEIFKNLL